MTFQGSINIWQQTSTYLGINQQTYRGPTVPRNFGFYFANSVQWQQSSATNPVTGAPLTILTFTSSGGSTIELDVVSLVTQDAGRLADWQKYSQSSVTGGSVKYEYLEDQGLVDITYSITTSSGTNALLALYPHQYKHTFNTDSLLSDVVWTTSRGKMLGYAGTGYKLRFKYIGFLPSIPHLATDSAGEISNLIDQFMIAPASFRLPQDADSYWSGKAFGKVADMILVAQSIGRLDVMNQLLSELKLLLGDWLSFSGNGDPRYFYYDSRVRSMIGFPASYGSDQELNDHHFHYGYFIKAAAVIAMTDVDLTWINTYRDMVELLIRDVSNWQAEDTQYPYNRQFDAIEGHHYASGHAAFGSGNNQESSSEAMNYNAAIIYWGTVIPNNDIRDMGIFMYTLEANAIQQYWFNVDKDNFPSSFSSPYCSLLWDDGGSYEIFWGPPHAEELLGIDLMPVGGQSLYLGLQPDTMNTYYSYMVQMNGGQKESMWQDIIWTWQAMYNANAALASYRATTSYDVEAGTTQAHTLHWLVNWQKLGHIETQFSANVPLYSAFQSGYRVAYNPTPSTITVTWSDGQSFPVAARSFAVYLNGNAVTSVPLSGAIPSPPPPPGSSSNVQSSTSQTLTTSTKLASSTSSIVMSSTTSRSVNTSTHRATTSKKPHLHSSTKSKISTSSIMTPSPTQSNAPQPSIVRKVTVNGACGFDGPSSALICPLGACCSQWGWCGFTTDYCNTNCQSAFGVCA